MEYVKYSVYKHGHRLDFMLHDRLHGAEDGKTLCGLDLNDRWVIVGDSSREIKEITCHKCRNWHNGR